MQFQTSALPSLREYMSSSFSIKGPFMGDLKLSVINLIKSLKSPTSLSANTRPGLSGNICMHFAVVSLCVCLGF